MSNHVSNFPPNKLKQELKESPDFTKDTIHSLMELSKQGKPKDINELRQRLQYYFDFCADNDYLPGIESISLCLGTTRSTFWRWCNSENGEEWAIECQKARQAILSFIESATVKGKISAPVGIFCLKNIGSWKDTLSFEDATPREADHESGIKAVMASVLKDSESINAKFSDM